MACDPDAHTEWSYKNNGERIVYLTFDDGPSKNTQRVLDILDRYGAKATFFVVGHDPDHYDMIKRAYDDYPNIILLCHDAATKDTTVEALPAIIEHYQALGYRFCAIDRSTMVPHHKVAN